MRPNPNQIAAGLVITGIALLTAELMRRLVYGPPGSTADVMESARNNPQVRDTVRSSVGRSSDRSSQAEFSVCARYCGDDLDFGVGVVRCPYGETSEHLTGPFYHDACLTEDGKCPVCQFTLRGVGTYLVHDARTVPPKPPETWAAVTAARWDASYQSQQERMLCYATAASAVWKAFGQSRTPRECAHYWAFSPSAVSDAEDNLGASLYPRYTALYNKLKLQHTSATVRQVQALMDSDQAGNAAFNDLTGQFGEPVFEGIGVPVKKLTGLVFAGVRDAIDNNRLILAGDYNHWIVAYGYRTSTRGGQEVNYFDPKTGGAKQVSYVSFISGKDEIWVIG